MFVAMISFVVLLVITPIVALYTLIERQSIQNYRNNGVVVSASVGDVYAEYYRRYTVYTAEVQFFTEGGMSEGELVTTEISQFLNKETVSQLGDEENVVYLPKDPEKKVVFEKSLDPANFSRLQRWNLSLILLLGTILSFGAMKLVQKKESQKKAV